MVLPTAPSLLSDPKKTDTTEPEKASETAPTSEEGAQNMDADIADDDTAKSKDGAKNGSDDCNGSNAVEKMETAIEELFTVKKDDIIAQVCTFMEENIIYIENILSFVKND